MNHLLKVHCKNVERSMVQMETMVQCGSCHPLSSWVEGGEGENLLPRTSVECGGLMPIEGLE